MIQRAVYCGLAVFMSAASAYAEDCKAIVDSAARLSCFDKGAPKQSPRAIVHAPAAAHAAAGPAWLQTAPAARDGGWELRIIKDGFNDKTQCVISPVGHPWVQINVGQLYLDFRSRGGVEGFSIRVDDNPAAPMQLPSPVDKSISMVHLKGDPFFQAVSGNRLRIQTFTVLRQVVDEDLDLAPMKRLYKRMGPECEQK